MLCSVSASCQDSDLRSALFLEQAAHCFINSPRPMVRKYAFHMILAGHRFSKAGQVGNHQPLYASEYPQLDFKFYLLKGIFIIQFHLYQPNKCCRLFMYC